MTDSKVLLVLKKQQKKERYYRYSHVIITRKFNGDQGISDFALMPCKDNYFIWVKNLKYILVDILKYFLYFLVFL